MLQKKTRRFIQRNIKHPLFKNVDVMEAQKLLMEAEVGEVLLRPSSRGLMNLSLTMKFGEAVYAHMDIKEGGKDDKQSANNLRLGSPLFIGGDQYEDLDEVRHHPPAYVNVCLVDTVPSIIFIHWRRLSRSWRA